MPRMVRDPRKKRPLAAGSTASGFADKRANRGTVASAP